MFRLRPLITNTIHSQTIFEKIKNQTRSQRFYHYEEPTKPFDNLPFRVKSRYTLTMAFAVFYGLGLWAPFFIVWYSMAKRTM